MDKISIIVPIYNSEKYLRKTIESLLNQTYHNIEVILIDDCSTDNSLTICKSYNDSRIRVIPQKTNTGVSNSRNIGVEKATGDYIMFLDSDDWLDLNTCYSLIENINSEIDFLFFNYIKECQNKSIKINVCNYDHDFVLNKQMIKSLLLRRMFGLNNNELKYVEDCDRLLPVCMKLYKTSIIKNNNIKFIDLSSIGTSEDGLFNIEYLKYCKCAKYMNNYYYHYRRDNSNSITRNLDEKIYKKWSVLYNHMRNHIEENQYDYEESLQNRIIISIIGYGLSISQKKYNFFKKRKYLKEFVNSKEYIKVINNINLKYFSLKWKFFFFLVKYKLFFCLVLMLNLMVKIAYRHRKEN